MQAYNWQLKKIRDESDSFKIFFQEIRQKSADHLFMLVSSKRYSLSVSRMAAVLMLMNKK